MVRKGIQSPEDDHSTTVPNSPAEGRVESDSSATQIPLVGRYVLVFILLVGAGFAVGRGAGSRGDRSARSTISNASTTVSAPKTLLDVALEFHEAGRLDDAVRAYNAVLMKEPDNAYALYNLGVIYQGRTLLASAIEKYSAVLAVDDKFTSARYNRALAYRDSGKPDLAIEDLVEVIKAEPSNAKAMYNLGNVYISQGREDQGSKLITDALSINPNLKDG